MNDLTPDTEALVRSLAQRVALLEDKLAITELMTAYGPAIDSGSPRLSPACGPRTVSTTSTPASCVGTPRSRQWSDHRPTSPGSRVVVDTSWNRGTRVSTAIQRSRRASHS